MCIQLINNSTHHFNHMVNYQPVYQIHGHHHLQICPIIIDLHCPFYLTNTPIVTHPLMYHSDQQ